MTDANDLYGLPLERFVPERGAQAKSLRAEGDREQAASVAGRRKPSVAAWAVNQLVRTQDRAIASLFQAGDVLLHTQAELLAGRGDARALREAAERERAAVDELVKTSRGLLSTKGYELTQATLDRVIATLHAAALSEDAREKVRAGCLERELRYVGFGTTEATGLGTSGATGLGTSGATGAPAQPTPATARAAKTRSGAKRAAKGLVKLSGRKRGEPSRLITPAVPNTKIACRMVDETQRPAFIRPGTVEPLAVCPTVSRRSLCPLAPIRQARFPIRTMPR